MAGPSSIIGCQAVRIGRLTANGTPDFNNASGGFMLCGGISTFQHDYVKQDGEDLYVQDANGDPCVIRKKKDKVKRVSFTLTMCRSDYRIDEILGLAHTVVNGGVVVGRTMDVGQGCGVADTNYGQSIELWSEQWDCDDALTGAPYMRTVLPRAYVTPGGFTRQNGVAMPVYTGYSVPNDNFGDGPWGDLDLLVGATGWALADLDNTVIPTCPSTIGYINMPGSAS